MGSLIEDIKNFIRTRPTIILKEPLIKRLTGGYKILVDGEWLNAEIDRIKEEKLREWEVKGVPLRMRTYAMDLAESWTGRMIEFATKYLPEDMKMKAAREMSVRLFKTALEDVAERWLRAFGHLPS